MPFGLGEKVGEAYVRIFANADSVPGDIRRGIDDAGPEVHRSGEDLGHELGDGMDEGFEKSPFMENFTKRMTTMVDRLVDGDFADSAHELQALLASSNDDTIADDIDDVGDSARRSHRPLSKFTSLLTTASSHVDDFADVLGGATGRGSRNNFLNFIGSTVRNLTKLVALPFKGFVKIFDTFMTGFEKGSTFIGSMGSGLAALLPMLGAVAAGFAALAIGLAVLSAILGPILSILSMLAGVITALFSSIAFAATVALPALAAIALPALAVVAVALGGILSMSDEMKEKFSNAFEPIKNSFTDLGDIAAKVFTGGLTNQADRFADILGGLAPLVRGVARAIVAVGNSWLDMMEGKGFSNFIEAMSNFLPGAIRRLGDIIGNTFGGLGGLLVGMIPAMRQVLSWLDDITQRFSDWANSGQGKREIERFFDRAIDSLSEVWDFLDSVWDLIVTILDAGKGSGDTIFERMARTVEGWNDALQKNPDILKDWFTDAEAFASDLGTIIDTIGRLFDTLEDDDTRQTIHDIVDLFGQLREFVGVLKQINDIAAMPFQPIIDGLQAIWDLITNINDVSLPDWLADLPGGGGFGSLGLDVLNKDQKPFVGSGGAWFTDMVPQISDEAWTKILNFPENAEVKKHFEDVARWAGMVFEGQAIDFFEIIDWGNTEDVSKKMQPLVNAIMKPLRGLFFDIMDMFGIPHPEEVAAKVRAVDIPGRIENAIGNNTVELENAFHIPDPAAIARNFSRQAQEIMNAIGIDSIDLERSFDVPSPQSIADQFVSLASQILGAIGIIDLGGLFRVPTTVQGPTVVDSHGTPIDTPHRAMVGDSAVATVGPSWTASGGKTINASGWTIVSPTEDAEAVATEVVNQLAAVGY